MQIPTTSQARRRAAPSCARHAALRTRRTQWSVVCRLQRWVQARQRALLLSAAGGERGVSKSGL